MVGLMNKAPYCGYCGFWGASDSNDRSNFFAIYFPHQPKKTTLAYFSNDESWVIFNGNLRFTKKIFFADLSSVITFKSIFGKSVNLFFCSFFLYDGY